MAEFKRIEIMSVVVTPLEENCYILWNDSGDCVVVDPGGEVERIIAALGERQLRPQFILNTHGHIDHVGANADLRDRTGASIGVHAMDAPMLESALLCGAQWIGLPYRTHSPDFLYSHGETVGAGGITFEAFHVPGHSPGSCMLLNRNNGLLLGGDLVFAGAVGRWDLPGGDEQILFESILEHFLPLPDDVRVFPGHGPATTVGEERRNNPFLVPLEQLRREHN